jgi:hypothetical protein
VISNGRNTPTDRLRAMAVAKTHIDQPWHEAYHTLTTEYSESDRSWTVTALVFAREGMNPS